jgi:hypothetical protein
LAGCWRASEITADRRERSIAAGDPRVLVVPLNTSVALASGLEAGVEPVHREILGYLQAQGARVSFLAVEDARALWSQTVQTVRSLRENGASLQVVAGVFVRALDSETDFDLLVMPSLGYREANVNRGYADWDGVRRSLTARHQELSRGDQIHVFSLHAQVYTPDGRLWFQRWSGIDLVYASDLADESSVNPNYLREHVDRIRQAVARALAPISEQGAASD